MKEEYPKQRKIKTSDGTIIHLWGKQMHSWDGPSFIPQGNNKLAEYYVYGIRYTKDKWLEAKKDQNGLPFFKTAAGKQSGERY